MNVQSENITGQEPSDEFDHPWFWSIVVYVCLLPMGLVWFIGALWYGFWAACRAGYRSAKIAEKGLWE